MSAQELLDAMRHGNVTQTDIVNILSALFNEQDLVLIPAAGRVSGNKATADNLQLSVSIPEGLTPIGYKIEHHVNVSGAAGTGTASISSLIQQVRISSEALKNEAYINGPSVIDMVALESAIAWGKKQHADTVVAPVVAANATDYYGSWIIRHLPKGRQLLFQIDTNPVSGLAGFSTAPTGATYDAMVVVFCQKTPAMMTEQLYATLAASLSKITLPDQDFIKDDSGRGVVDTVFITSNNNELSGYLSGLVIGSQEFNNQGINALEEYTNFLLSQSGTPNAVTTGVGQQTYGTLPYPSVAANKLFALYQQLRRPGVVSVSTSTANNTIFVTRTARRA
jgi:hypothetical protein